MVGELVGVPFSRRASPFMKRAPSVRTLGRPRGSQRSTSTMQPSARILGHWKQVWVRWVWVRVFRGPVCHMPFGVSIVCLAVCLSVRWWAS